MLHQFLGDVLPDAGYYCLFTGADKRHHWAETQAELAEMIVEMFDRVPLYFGTAAFQSVANRKQANVLSLKSLRLDIDAGAKKHAKDPEGTYPTQRDALAASVAWIKASALVPTYIVSSGEGLHLYWCMTESLTPDAWLPLAEGLGRLARQHGLKADSSVTTDTARILRPPGALHDNGKAVAILKAIDRLYTPDDLRARLSVRTAPAYDTSINSDTVTEFQGPPVSAWKVVKHCTALRQVADSKGDVPEPHWRAMIGLVKRCVEGEDLVHEWSEGYDGYDYDETSRKFHAWTTGPTTCAEFSKHTNACLSCEHRGRVKSPIGLGEMTETEIETLPEEVKPPEPAPPAPTGDRWDGAIPAGFEVRKDDDGHLTLVHRMKISKISESGDEVPTIVTVPVTHQIFWFRQWAEADNDHDGAQVVLDLWTGTDVKTYTMDQALIASPSKLLEYLASKTIQTTTHKKAAQAMVDYAKAQLQRIRSMGKRPKVADHLGLRILDDGTLVCAHGKHIIRPDGRIEEGMLSTSLTEHAKTFTLPLPPSATGEWDTDVWAAHIEPRARRHVEFLRKYYGPGTEKFQLAILMGMASPLMAFVTGGFQSGSQLPKMSALSVSLYSSESARGKTTACEQVALAYGRVSEQTNDAGTLGATDKARIASLSMLGTFPSIMDEMGSASPGSVAATISAVANGAGRRTMTQNRAMRAEAPWSLINLITTNVSQRDMVSAAEDNSGAIQYRLLEINVADMPEYSRELRDSFRGDWTALADCGGALGAVIHREIVKRGVAGANKLVADCVARADKMVQADQTDRFQYRGLGAMLALATLLHQVGLLPFKLPPVIEEFKRAYDTGKDFIRLTVLPSDSLERLSQALLELAPYTVITQNETRIGGKSTNYDVPLNARVPDRILARHIVSTGRTYISTHAIRDWCKERGVHELEMMRAAQKAGALIVKDITRDKATGKTGTQTTDYYHLCKGMKTDMDLRLRCYTIDTRRLAGYTGVAAAPDNVVELRSKSTDEINAEAQEAAREG